MARPNYSNQISNESGKMSGRAKCHYFSSYFLDLPFVILIWSTSTRRWHLTKGTSSASNFRMTSIVTGGKIFSSNTVFPSLNRILDRSEKGTMMTHTRIGCWFDDVRGCTHWQSSLVSTTPWDFSPRIYSWIHRSSRNSRYQPKVDFENRIRCIHSSTNLHQVRSQSGG